MNTITFNRNETNTLYHAVLLYSTTHDNDNIQPVLEKIMNSLEEKTSDGFDNSGIDQWDDWNTNY